MKIFNDVVEQKLPMIRPKKLKFYHDGVADILPS